MEATYANTALNFRLMSGIILLEAEAEGEKGWMAFDTGAMQTALYTKHFPGLQGKAREIAKFNGQVESAAAEQTVLDTLALPPVTLREQPAMLMDFAYVEDSLRQENPELRFLGALGIDAIRNFSVLIDYAGQRLTLNPDCDTGGAAGVPLRMEALPVVELEVAGTPRPFVLDTGANTCLLSHELREEIPAAPLPDMPVLSVIPSVSLGGIRCRDVAAVFTDLSQIRSVVPVDGVIGYQILSQCRPLFDFRQETLYLLRP